MPIKSELEQIPHDKESSIRLMVNPNLSDFFYWHFHPEYELVFIDGANGTRRVGEHISQFIGSDLVLIGSYIPHLNFDYGIRHSYEKMVIHLRPDFLKEALAMTPELQSIRQLMVDSQYAIAFGEDTKESVRSRIKELPLFKPFEQFLEILKILHQLSVAGDKYLLHDYPVENKHTGKDEKRLQLINDFIERNYHRKIENQEVADLCSLANEAFCRFFRKMTKLTFTEFVNHYRVDKAKKMLLNDSNVSEACYSCGFESLSYFNRTFNRVTGQNPTGFLKDYSQNPSLQH